MRVVFLLLLIVCRASLYTCLELNVSESGFLRGSVSTRSLGLEGGEEEGGLSHDYCRVKYGKRQFLDASKGSAPPMLYSFPGSGNTWTRLLVEFATGYYTGSVYNDEDLMKIFPGEERCDASLIGIKVHPNHLAYDPSRRVVGKTGKCHKIRPFKSAVALIRNPYDSIWSEYQRKTLYDQEMREKARGGGDKDASKSSHQGKLLKKNFDERNWRLTAMGMAKATQKVFELSYEVMKKEWGSDFIVIKFEDLLREETKYEALAAMRRFLFAQAQKTFGLDLASKEEDVDERIRCAFVLSDLPSIHRKSNNAPAIGSELRESLYEPFVSKKDAYKNEHLVCNMYGFLKNTLRLYDYDTFNHVDCEQKT